MLCSSDRKIAKKYDCFIESEVGSDTILMHLESGKFYSLSGTGRRAWALLEAHPDMAGLVAAMTEEFAIAPEDCARDLLVLFDRLADQGLVAFEDAA